MEKVFVHPECPFSVEAFNLLAQFYNAEDRSDFYMARKKDFLKYIEQPLKYISSQVEEMLPFFIKKHINVKCEKLREIERTTDFSYSMAYSVAFGLEYIMSLDDVQLMLILDRQSLNFGLYAASDCVSRILNNYQSNYIDHPDDIMRMLKTSFLPNHYYCYLTQEIIPINSPWSKSNRIFMEPKKSIYELLEHIISLTELPPKVKKNTITNFQIFISLESQELLGYSAKLLIQKITHTFKQIFPLCLCAKLYDDDADLLFMEIYSAYDKELNPVYSLEYFSYIKRENTGFPVDKLITLLQEVNEAINNKHYQLGISFFLTKNLTENIQDIWQMEIEPYLEEYFFDDREKMDEFLWDKIQDKFSD